MPVNQGEASGSHPKKKPCFFRIIHPSVIQDGKLGLPKKFVRELGEELSDVAVLTVPNGKTWHVRLVRTDGRVWFQSGWQKFVDYHSIHVGHFLVFNYDCNSYFNVLIFDMSGLEIEYMCSSNNIEEPNHGGGFPGGSQRTEQNIGDMAAPKSHLYSQTVSTHEHCVIRTASTFESDNPFFRAVMQPTYLSGKYGLSVNLDFMRTYLQENVQTITLIGPDGRSWDVRCHLYKDTAKLYKGWQTFVKEYNLRQGDTCIFELTQIEKVILKVSIFRSGCSSSD